jgi:hypothetical protein
MGVSCSLVAATGAGVDIIPFDARQAVQVPEADADALYRDRENLASALAAVDAWAQRLAADPSDFESAWKVARGRYWLGTNGLPEDRRRAALEAGLAAARIAAALQPARPEGHFWSAANMGALAESFGLRQGLKYRKAIRESLDVVLKLDPGFLQGSADRALGRWYFKVPGLFGGSMAQSEAHLRKALTYAPDSVISRVFLAETLEARGQRAAALEQVRAAIAAPLDPEWAPEDRRFKQQAQALLLKLSR